MQHRTRLCLLAGLTLGQISCFLGMHFAHYLASLSQRPKQSASAQSAKNDRTEWPIGLRILTTDTVPDGTLWGTKRGWIDLTTPSAAVTISAGEQDFLEIKLHKSTQYEADLLELHVTKDKLLAAANAHTCTSFWQEPHLSGTACIITDGATAALEFEIYDGSNAAYANAYFGRVQLGSRLDCASLDATPLSLAAQLEFKRFAYQPQPDLFMTLGKDQAPSMPKELEIHGHVDGLGRRQGLWTVKPRNEASSVLEMNWRDGIPDGPYILFLPEEKLTRIGAFVAGFEDGLAMELRHSGDRMVQAWDKGRLHGKSTLYGADGSQTREWSYSNGSLSNTDPDAVSPEEVSSSSSAAATDSWLSFLKDLNRLQTRTQK